MAEKVIRKQIEVKGIKRDKDVEEIYLAECDINEAIDLSRFRNLQRLWLNNNKLYQLGGLENSFQLTELYVQNNMITDINGALQHLTCLQVLHLHGNQLTVLTDVIHELRNILNLKNLNLFGNPVAQEYNYRMYVIYSVKSLEILDRKEINKEERVKSLKKYEAEKQRIKESVAFGRRAERKEDFSYEAEYNGPDNSCLRDFSLVKCNPDKQRHHIDDCFASAQEAIGQEPNLVANETSNTLPKNEAQRSLLQFKRFGWVDVLEAKQKSSDNNTTPFIYTTTFR